MDIDERIQKELIFLYGERTSKDFISQLNIFIHDFSNGRKMDSLKRGEDQTFLSQNDVILITYADQIHKPEEAPLATLGRFLNQYLSLFFSGIHILPFYPYSSDDGFSVINYYEVNPNFGNWNDIRLIGNQFRLMFDAVINHVSSKCDWFQAFLRRDNPYDKYFITVDPSTDLSEVVRPRNLPLLTKYKTIDGESFVWTTFSEDQIDLNYSNPDVLLEIIKVLLFYVENGSEIIRLDAIAYLWKEIGTSCIHLPQTHSVIRLLRAILDKVAPNVLLITETNVPHEENISYFGRYLEETGFTDEAQLVYQFPLAPLILHTFHKGNSKSLMDWLKFLENDAIFFNFIASHDGIGVLPAKGILNSDEIQLLVDLTLSHNGKVSYKANHDGSKSVYELNITLYDALNNPNNPNDELDIKRFLASQAILLSLKGVPGIYFHSLFGLRNCGDCVSNTKRLRSINREKLSLSEFEKILNDPNSISRKVFDGYCDLLHKRKSNKSFHPKGSQIILSLPTSVFGILRKSPDESQALISLINVTDQDVVFSLDISEFLLNKQEIIQDILSNKNLIPDSGEYSITLSPYQVMWIQI
jgi:glycosidase